MGNNGPPGSAFFVGFTDRLPLFTAISGVQYFFDGIRQFDKQ